MKKSACSDMKKLMDLVHEAAGIEGIRVNWRMNEWTVPKTVRLHECVSKYFDYDKSTDGRGRKELFSSTSTNLKGLPTSY